MGQTVSQYLPSWGQPEERLSLEKYKEAQNPKMNTSRPHRIIASNPPREPPEEFKKFVENKRKLVKELQEIEEKIKIDNELHKEHRHHRELGPTKVRFVVLRSLLSPPCLFFYYVFLPSSLFHRSIIHSFVLSFVHSFIHSFIRSFFHLLILTAVARAPRNTGE